MGMERTSNSNGSLKAKNNLRAFYAERAHHIASHKAGMLTEDGGCSGKSSGLCGLCVRAAICNGWKQRLAAGRVDQGKRMALACTWWRASTHCPSLVLANSDTDHALSCMTSVL